MRKKRKKEDVCWKSRQKEGEEAWQIKTREKEERLKKRAQTLQTALWAGLILIQMAVVDSLTVQAAQTEPSESERTLVERTVTYRQVEGAASLPETLQVTVSGRGEHREVVCKEVKREVLKEYWLDDFTFPVTFHSWDAQYFQVRDRLIPAQEDRPGLEACELQLLDIMGLSPEEYKISSVVWDGEAYLDETGVLCRDARGTGKRLVRDYEVQYAGSVAHFPAPALERRKEEPTEPLWTEECLGQEKDASSEAVFVSPFAGQEEDTSRTPLTLWQIITRTMLIAVGIGALLFLGGLLVLFIRKIKRNRKWR